MVLGEQHAVCASLASPELVRCVHSEPPGLADKSSLQAECVFTFPSGCAGAHIFAAGESERVLHQLFNDAKKSKPSIIFLDELDALVSW